MILQLAKLVNIRSHIRVIFKIYDDGVEVDNLFVKLNEAYEALKKAVDLTEVVNISDSYLKEAIKSELMILL